MCIKSLKTLYIIEKVYYFALFVLHIRSIYWISPTKQKIC